MIPSSPRRRVDCQTGCHSKSIEAIVLEEMEAIGEWSNGTLLKIDWNHHTKGARRKVKYQMRCCLKID